MRKKRLGACRAWLVYHWGWPHCFLHLVHSLESRSEGDSESCHVLQISQATLMSHFLIQTTVSVSGKVETASPPGNLMEMGIRRSLTPKVL